MTNQDFNLSCPLPKSNYEQITLAHGGGGTIMSRLLDSIIRPAFSNDELNRQHDSAVLQVGDQRIAFTTDSYVVQPLFFPGGDIGSLAVHGTVNDLAMSGARPLSLSCGLILEEGLPMETLRQVLASMHEAAENAGVSIVTGDTKVVEKGKGDGIFINTAGVGILEHSQVISPQQVQAGDLILVNGDLGRHGIAIMATREGLEFETTIESDSASLASLVLRLLQEEIEIHCMRDLTRGGLASGLNEIATVANLQIELEENIIPVRDEVRGACEILGFDPLYVANEGRMILFLPEKDAERALSLMKSDSQGTGAAIIGKVTGQKKAQVLMKSLIGATRIVDKLSGEQLPRIC